MIRYIRHLPARPQPKNISSAQGVLDLQIDRQAEIDGIGMGVLSDGTPFLNQRGLARLCGVQNAHIGTISTEWGNEEKPRIAAIRAILAKRRIALKSPHIKVYHGTRQMLAYPEPVCMAVLEYYAFDAGPNIQPEAQQRFRWLAGRSLRDIIYTQLGYKPRSEIAEVWQQFHDRVSLVYDSVPRGYFCIFKEIADVMVTLINAGAPVGNSFIPDISVGQAWSRHWNENELHFKFGDRRKYEHHYPDYFPQAASNPQTPFCYPDAALGEFRRWMHETYLPSGLPVYLEKKVQSGEIDPRVSKIALTAIAQRAQRSTLLES
jgi:hypothetical protein